MHLLYAPTMDYLCLLLTFFYWKLTFLAYTTSLMGTTTQAVMRKAQMNSALHLECRENQFIKINRVILGRMQPECSYTLRPAHNDYKRVVAECSGQQSCSNIVLKDSTRIPCTNIGLQDSEFMAVDYTCVAEYNNLNICHNTKRTMSLFEGYLSSPGYPSLPTAPHTQTMPNNLDIASLSGVVCNCQVVAHSYNTRLQFLLVDMADSKQVKISEPSGTDRYLCSGRRSGGCVNDLQPSYHSSVNITYRPMGGRQAKFLLQYSAVGQRSRVKVECKMTFTPAEDVHTSLTSLSTMTSSPSTTVNSTKTEKLEEEIFSLEVIVGVCAAAVFLLICVIVLAATCRRCQQHQRAKRSNGTSFKVLTRDSNPTYDMVAHDTQYATIRVRNSRGSYGHFYHEPADLVQPPEYSEPFINNDGCGSPAPQTSGVYYSRTSEASGIYESMENIEDAFPDQHSGLSQMKKSSSMPHQPAPPIPRNASAKQSAKQLTVAQQYDVPGPAHNTNTPALSDSLDSMPKLDLDFSDLLRETDRFIQQTDAVGPYENTNITRGAADMEYMQPVRAVRVVRAACPLIENELYLPDQ